ncbi:MAG: VWA domain-containing protein, partial [Gammaproteobacteria bacterium]|nr:VWA domain-containing protein [Gammaproteobacteria bacterium]
MPDFAQPGWLSMLFALPLLLWLGLKARSFEGRFKRIAGALLRCLTLAALVIVLAGPLKGSFTEQTDVVFALDVSRSIDRETSRAAVDFINRALADKDPAARMGLVVFGEDTATEMLLRDAAEPLGEISVDVIRTATNIGRALEVAMSLFQGGANRRVVLLSDGRENAGQARAAAAVARSIGVQISTIALQREASPAEVLVRDMTLPARVRVHEPFNLEINLQSTTHSPAHLVVTRNAVPIGELALTLKPGTNVATLADQALEPGLYEYEAIVNSDHDGVAENNRYQAFVQVRGQPRVLHAVGEAGWGRYVSNALRTQGL